MRTRNPRTLHPTLHRLVVPLVASLAFAALAMTPAPDRDTVAIVVSDNSIQIADTLKAGTTTFEVTNRGADRHSFAIARDGGDAVADLDAELAPGETATLQYDLKEGQYGAYCPMHRDALNARFTVVGERVSN